LLIAEQQDTQRGWYLLLMRAAGQRHAQPKQTAKQREYRGERQLPAPRPGRRSASPSPQQQYVPSLLQKPSAQAVVPLCEMVPPLGPVTLPEELNWPGAVRVTV